MRLTAREAEALDLLESGLTQKEVQQRLGVCRQRLAQLLGAAKIRNGCDSVLELSAMRNAEELDAQASAFFQIKKIAERFVDNRGYRQPRQRVATVGCLMVAFMGVIGGAQTIGKEDFLRQRKPHEAVHAGAASAVDPSGAAQGGTPDRPGDPSGTGADVSVADEVVAATSPGAAAPWRANDAAAGSGMGGRDSGDSAGFPPGAYWLSTARGGRAKLHRAGCRYVKQGHGGTWYESEADAPPCERCRRCLNERESVR